MSGPIWTLDQTGASSVTGRRVGFFNSIVSDRVGVVPDGAVYVQAEMTGRVFLCGPGGLQRMVNMHDRTGTDSQVDHSVAISFGQRPTEHGSVSEAEWSTVARQCLVVHAGTTAKSRQYRTGITTIDLEKGVLIRMNA